MNFANKEALWLLLVFPPVLVFFFWWSWRKRRELSEKFIQARLLPGLTLGLSATRQKIRCACLLGAVICAILALARPQWGFAWEEVKQRGLDIVVAIDTSKSMLATDIAPNRLARAKLAALDLMKLAKSDRLGLVAFAGQAFLQCPLTIDDTAFRQSVESLDVNTIPQGGTAIAEAIDTAVAAFKEKDNYKVVVLFTDGEDHDSGALSAAKRAADEGLQLFTVGVGTPAGELISITDAQGKRDFVRDADGNVVKSHLNETLLEQLARTTEFGFYLPLRGANTMDMVYQRGIAPLPKTDSKEKLVRQYLERYHWPLLAAIIFLMIEMLYPERKRGAAPKPAEALSKVPAVAGRALPLVVLLGFSAAALASPSSALRNYQSGQYGQALKEYEQLLKGKSTDPRLRYNAGAAAYRDKRFDEAVKHFDEALAAQDLKLQERVYYNRGNTLYQLGETSPDPKKKQESWERALRDFQSSLKLNSQDGDAKHNYNFVKQKIEELKQQQQQQQNQKNDQNQDQNKDQKDQQNQDQQKQDQQKQDQQQQDQQQSGSKDQQQQNAQQDQKKDGQNQQQQKQQAQQKDEKDQQQQSQANQGEKKDGQPSQASAGEGEKKDGQEAEAMAGVPGQMTAEQARQLLEAQKGHEKMLTFKPDAKPRESSRVFKDW